MKSGTPHIALFLLLLFALNQSATWFNATQIHYHRQQERLNKYPHINQILTLTYSQFKKAKKMETDEIMLEGRMFDVKSIQFTHHEVILVGHFDSKEDGLLAKAKEHESKNEKQNKSFKIPLLFIESYEWSYKHPSLVCTVNKHMHYLHQLLSPSIPFDSPPPQFV